MAEAALPKRGPKYCCVVGCRNSAENTKGLDPPVKLYRFPGKWYEKERLQAWINAVRRVRWQRRLNQAISSRQLGAGSENPSRSTDDEATMHKPGTSITDCRHQDIHMMDLSDAPLEMSAAVASTISTSDLHPSMSVCGTGESHFIAKRDAASQTKASVAQGMLTILLSATNGTDASTQVVHTEMSDKVASTDGNWKKNCGFQGFQSLKEKEKALQDLCGVTLQVFCLLLNLLPPPKYRRNTMSNEDRLCLFLAKLRLGITYSTLGVIFSVAPSTASTVFRKTLGILSIALKDWVFMPSRRAIKLSLPAPFKENYPNCTLIIDCTEIRTEAPSNPDCQHILYSHYKGGYTLKFLIGIIPNGMISFVSKVYGGRHTDSFITQDSGFLELVRPGDLILSDKGFPSIRTTVEGKGAVLLMPPFNSTGGQMSDDDMDMTYKIASVRIHVEIVIQRLKIFHILRNRVPLSLIPHMKKVFSVCAALVNLQPPIIKQ
ncbi:uncharacterized protein LOC144133986 isoform X2 [Amblyomma americanum]